MWSCRQFVTHDLLLSNLLTYPSSHRSQKMTRSQLAVAVYKPKSHFLISTFRTISSYKVLTPHRPLRLEHPLFSSSTTHMAAASYPNLAFHTRVNRRLSLGPDLNRRTRNSNRTSCNTRLKGPSKERRIPWVYHTPTCRDTHRLRTSIPTPPATGKNHFHP